MPHMNTELLERMIEHSIDGLSLMLRQRWLEYQNEGGLASFSQWLDDEWFGNLKSSIVREGSEHPVEQMSIRENIEYWGSQFQVGEYEIGGEG